VSFQAPLFLLALALLPALAWLYLRRERHDRDAREAFAPAALLPSVVPARPGWRRHVPVVACLVALAALMVALARPEATVAVDVEQATIVLATDRSGSMRADDVPPTRLDAAKEAQSDFLDAVSEDTLVGAIAFNQRPEVIHSPTRDHDAVREAIEQIEIRGSTAVGEALDAALSMIEAARGNSPETAPAAIVLLSDGKSVRGRDPLPLADDALEAGVPVHTVSLGTDWGTITRDGQELRRPPDPESMQEIAERSGGRHFEIEDAERLSEVYEELGSQVAGEERRQEITGAFAGGALALLVIAVLASLRWFGRVI
jgi:Ca-activated chloride channel homolog